jgi:phosphoglycolate phosphatase
MATRDSGLSADGILFDLDGTLWNATPAVAKAWNRGIGELGIARDGLITPEEVAAVAGRLWDECIRRVIPGIPEERIAEVSRLLHGYQREEIAAGGGTCYEGVREGIPLLARHYPLFIVSNCHDWYLDSFLRLSGLAPHFVETECYGASGLPKDENIRRVVARNDLGNPLYVGDTLGDSEAAEAAGVRFVHAAWGFGRFESPFAFRSFPELLGKLIPADNSLARR